jgi:adenylyl- and sulfurtransferase ThiI
MGEGRAAVVLLSGGLDSATALAIARSQGFTCRSLAISPAIHFLRVHTKRNGGKKLRGRRFATPVVSAAVTHLHAAGRDRIKHTHRRYNFVSAIHMYLQTTRTHFIDVTRKGFGSGAQAGKIFRPGCHHAPSVHLL